MEGRGRALAYRAISLSINVGAALSKNSRGVSHVAVARDAIGKYMGASSVAMRGIVEPETMEVLARGANG